MTTRRCPYCAEDIATEAIRCRHCRSRLVNFDLARWHRAHREARIAGVCAALAHGLATPVVWVRAAFVLLTFLHLLGPILYGILWLLLPASEGSESLLETGLGRGHEGLRRWRTAPPAPEPNDTGSTTGG